MASNTLQASRSAPVQSSYSVWVEWAQRRCLESGLWQGPPLDVTEAAMLDPDPANAKGWTNYTACYLPEMRDMMEQLNSGSPQEAEVSILWPFSPVNTQLTDDNSTAAAAAATTTTQTRLFLLFATFLVLRVENEKKNEQPIQFQLLLLLLANQTRIRFRLQQQPAAQ